MQVLENVVAEVREQARNIIEQEIRTGERLAVDVDALADEVRLLRITTIDYSLRRRITARRDDETRTEFEERLKEHEGKRATDVEELQRLTTP